MNHSTGNYLFICDSRFLWTLSQLPQTHRNLYFQNTFTVYFFATLTYFSMTCIAVSVNNFIVHLLFIRTMNPVLAL